jgi:hypothetical protein
VRDRDGNEADGMDEVVVPRLHHRRVYRWRYF